ncbi:MAG: SusC/RagA family protein [Bacteroidetes bacterium]|nr:MAG: SusC/RagA family protein [Bacteroidota bacterium]
MRKKRLPVWIAVFLSLLLISSQAFSQNKTVTGKVTDANSGQPLQGVSVVPKGSKKGAVTGADGSFTINIPANTSTLVLSSIGFSTREIPVSGGNLEITMTETNASLNEVVVIAYGTARKKDLTGSVATVTAKDFQQGSFTTPEQLIQGKIPGVSIISNSGQPGAGSTIRIRGGSSLSASNDPLIVLDGVPLDNDQVPGAGNPLSFINPNDIESFTVLKDASASAIYGTRAANGVIIITTKKGKGGALKVNFRTLNSVGVPTKKVDLLSASQFRDIVNTYGNAQKKAMLGAANTDWQDQIYQDALGTDNHISITGGIPSLPYRLSLGYQYQNGILKTDHLQTTSLAFALNPVLLDNHLKIDLNFKGALQDARFGKQDAIGGANSFDPTKPINVKSNRFGGYYEWVDASGNLINLAGKNPVGILNQYYDESKPGRMMGNIQVDYKFHFLPDLHANLNLGFDGSQGKGTKFMSDSAAFEYTRGGEKNQYKQKKWNTLAEFYLNYLKDLPSIKSHFDVMAGYSYNNYLTTVYHYADYNAHGVKLAGTDPAFPLDKPEHTLISYFGRLNYSYNSRYLLTATLRRDGSSRFSPNNRWALFPSVAVAWNLKEESFLRTDKTVSSLKLRASYGVTGQQDGIGNYDYLSYYSLSQVNASYQFGDTYFQGFRPGGFYANRKWEQTATYNFAVDYGFLDNRINGSIEVYQKNTTNLLNNVPQPAGTNFSAYIVANVGSMENKGVEFNVNVQPIRQKDMTWDFGFNITYNKNTITNLTVIPGDTSYIGFPSGSIAGGIGGQFAFINAVGGPKNTFYLYKQVYDQKTGAPIEGLFDDKNRDGIINQHDLYKGKSADPKVYLGFSTNFTYKKWNAGFALRASYGNYIYNNIYSQTGNLNQILGNSVLYNASANYLTTKFKGGNAQQILSDYYLQNGSFLRMDNINIGYNVGKISTSKINLRMNFIVQNVFVITKYTGLDPEIPSGIDNNFYPRPRTFSLGLTFDY